MRFMNGDTHNLPLHHSFIDDFILYIRLHRTNAQWKFVSHNTLNYVEYVYYQMHKNTTVFRWHRKLFGRCVLIALGLAVSFQARRILILFETREIFNVHIYSYCVYLLM